MLAMIGPATKADALEISRRAIVNTKATAELRRGISFGNAMDAPNEGEWGWTISASRREASA